jgi:hypothetical protein
VTRPTRVRLEDILGKPVVGPDGKTVGRLEEVRAHRHGDDHEVTEYLIGAGALLERLSIVRRLLRRKAHMFVARWDQLDITGHKRLHLLCSAGDLKITQPKQR